VIADSKSIMLIYLYKMKSYIKVHKQNFKKYRTTKIHIWYEYVMCYY